ncbi:MAG: L-aspartate oxidase [Candidatus Gastranaerophilales bacterium]|nr:L-aspartate oxidase [Candidatus Gastranaerophilales bacterium]
MLAHFRNDGKITSQLPSRSTSQLLSYGLLQMLTHFRNDGKITSSLLQLKLLCLEYFKRILLKKLGASMKKSIYSLIIVGSGIAGLYAALKASELLKPHNKILILSKSDLKEGSSLHAQGGIASVLPQNKEDSVPLHVKDTLFAGAGLSDEKVAEAVAEKGAQIIDDLIKKGVLFDRDDNQNVALTLEAAHSVRRVLHAGGDATGKFIAQALSKRVLADSNIEIYPYCQAVELLIDDNSACRGVVILDEKTQTHQAIFANVVVLATGGSGQLFANTTNPSVSTGDGVVLAYRAGATLQDLEFVQFHPTVFKAQTNEESSFLISEAVRGEGAKLKNINGDEFAKNYHPKAELAPRDVVTRAIYFEMKKHLSDRVFLDAAKIPKAQLTRRFPSIYAKCLEYGIDITKDLIPVSPAAHYFMGGVRVRSNGKSDVEGLYATGEVSCTSLHGANRLASNSLLECVVLSDELARNFKLDERNHSYLEDEKIAQTLQKYDDYKKPEPSDVSEYKKLLKDIMWQYCGIIRDEKGLKAGLEKIAKLLSILKSDIFFSTQEYELKNMLTLSYLMMKSALERRESRGSHYRDDFKKTSSSAKHSYTNISRKGREDEIFFE